MPEGIILRGYSGFYYVKTVEGVWECSLRGRLRLERQNFLVGDKVKFKHVGPGKGVIEDVLPRKTVLLRPPIANVQQVIIVVALASPDPDLWLLDRLLVLSEAAGIQPVICFNKKDLLSREMEQELEMIYRDIGYLTVATSAKTEDRLNELKDILKDKVSVFAGPSGVGKSSLLNSIKPVWDLKTGEVSNKLSRGKHTTRFVSLLEVEGGGLVADSPGFSRLNMPEIRREELVQFFPEMDIRRNQCRFSSCLHAEEPDCAVKKAVEEGHINQARYKHYLEFLREVIAAERSF
ncbi:MAG: ribosome small subunit-dependent GTPase A [Bacillota bacterium]